MKDNASLVKLHYNSSQNVTIFGLRLTARFLHVKLRFILHYEKYIYPLSKLYMYIDEKCFIRFSFNLLKYTPLLLKKISFGKIPNVSLEVFMLISESRRLLNEANLPPSAYTLAMDTNRAFCNTVILFLKKIAMVKFSNEPGSESLLAWKIASWVQETILQNGHQVLNYRNPVLIQYPYLYFYAEFLVQSMASVS